jgi:hypothetical protein
LPNFPFSSLYSFLMWTIGSLLLIVFTIAERLVAFPLGRRSKWVFLVMLAAVLFIGWGVPVGDRRVDSPAGAAALGYEYGLISWEFENYFDKWGHRLWTVLPWTPTSEEDRREALDRYVELVDELRSARDVLNQVTSTGETEVGSITDAQNAVDRLIDERDGLRDGVEEFLEQIIAETVRSDEIDLVDSFVWPPVDFRIDDPPKLLVTSRRDEIVRGEDVLIDPAVSIYDMASMESELADLHDISAVVIQTGGLASYPNVIPTTHLKRLVDVGAHEWLHAYLVFHPLGRAYFKGGDIRSMNETLADIFGREVGLMVYSEVTGEPYVAPVRPETAFKRVTEDTGNATGEPEAVEDPEAFSFNRFMGETRSTTDEMLTDGLIDEAEAYMEARRVELNGHGYTIRKINQAYFAFHGTYAESPSSTSPIARYMWDLREQVESVGELVKLLSPLGSYKEFEQLLVERGVELEQSE